ncbi:MAG TPA: hypothetical protein VGC79_12965, partial [Polyangiaceae bacterium]
LASLLNDEVPEVSVEQRRKMPEELMRVIRRCLNRDPDQRFADVAQFARALLPMAPPSSEQLVVRIESMARAIPAVVETPPAESPPVLQHTHGSTLVSARSSLVGATSGATSSTHALDPLGLLVPRRRIAVKALALLAVVGALFYWFAVRGVDAHRAVDTATSAQLDRSQKPSESAMRTSRKEALERAPSASVEVGPVAPPPDVTPSSSAAPSASASATAAPSALPSVRAHSDRKNTRTQAGRNLPAPSSSSSASNTTGPSGAGRVGRPRPSSTADPKNQPQ